MKRFLLLSVFFLLFSLSLYSFSFVFDEMSVGIKNGELSFDVSRMGMRIKSRHFSFGAVDSGGDVKTLSNPHFSYSHGLYYSSPKKDTSLLSSTVSVKNLWFSLLYGERNAGSSFLFPLLRYQDLDHHFLFLRLFRRIQRKRRRVKKR